MDRKGLRVWVRLQMLACLGSGVGLSFAACAGRARDDGNAAARAAAGSGGTGGSSDASFPVGGGIHLEVGGRGPVTPAQIGGSPDVTAPDGAGGACDSPAPHSCDDLQGYLDDVPDEEANVELGSGDLTVLVIFDRSGSMSNGWDLRNKWQAASDSMIAGMAPYLSNLTVGAVLFPTQDCFVADLGDSAQIDFRPGRSFVSQWVESACQHQPDGSTPMGAAFAVADQSMIKAQALGLLDDRFRVMLVTDGEPNCNTDPAALVSYAQRWHDELGVDTFVIGLPGSEEATELLDSIALAGGTEKHAQAGNPCDFEQTVNIVAK